MNNALLQAFQILTGKPAIPEQLAAALSGLDDGLEIRRRILGRPELFALVPELRLAHEIRMLSEAKVKQDIRLVIGAAGTSFAGWVPTNADLFDLLQPNKWTAWLDPESVKAILAEHVWEHLDPIEGEIACRTCFRFLMPGGRLRIAVPDANHWDPAYHEIAAIGGPHGHKTYYDYKSLTAVLRRVGFDVTLLEYWDERGVFHENPWEPADGHIGRCRRFDPRNAGGVLKFTSLIVDGTRPLSGPAQR